MPSQIQEFLLLYLDPMRILQGKCPSLTLQRPQLTIDTSVVYMGPEQARQDL